MVDRTYSLSELCDLAGVTPRTVRYYIREGLLRSPGVRGPGTRYDDGHLSRLQLVKQLQRVHLPLAEIRNRLEALRDEEVEALLATPPEPPATSALEYVRSVLEAKGAASPAVLPGTPVGLRPSYAAHESAAAPESLATPAAPRSPAAPERPAWREVPAASESRAASESPATPGHTGVHVPVAASPEALDARDAAPPARTGQTARHSVLPGRDPAVLREAKVLHADALGFVPDAHSMTVRDEALGSRTTPAPDAVRADRPDRSSWERIALAPDMELHVRRPLSRAQNRLLEKLVEIARQLLKEEFR